MTQHLTALAGALQTLFSADAEELARETGLVRRRRHLDGPTLARTLVLGWLEHPEASLEQLAEFAAAAGADVSPQALDQRINPAAVAFLEQLLCRAVDRGCPVPADDRPLLGRFAGVYVFDTTDLTLPAGLAGEFPGLGGSTPGAGPAGVGLQVCLELSGRGIVDIQLAGIRTNDLAFELAHTGLPPGSLRLADLGFFSLELLAAYDAEGVYYLSRWRPHMRLYDAGGGRWDLPDYLGRAGRDGVDVWVRAGDRRLPCRLVAVRLPEEVANRRRQRLRQRKRDKGKPVSPHLLALCEWDVTITNVPAQTLTGEEVMAFRRLRWQVEVLFKQFKSVGRLDRVSGRRPARVLVELYARLLGQVVQSWQLLVSCGGAVRWSWYRCSRQLQGWWRSLVVVLESPGAVIGWLERVGSRLRRRGRKSRRRKRPAAFQLADGSYHDDLSELARKGLT